MAQDTSKPHLHALSYETGMAITVSHYPPGTSKWNKIEHRLFFISQNWTARPPVNPDTAMKLIGGMEICGRLKVKAAPDANLNETRLEIPAPLRKV